MGAQGGVSLGEGGRNEWSRKKQAARLRGWLTLLVGMRVATEKEAREAMSRVAQKAIDEMNERRERRRAEQGRKKKK